MHTVSSSISIDSIDTIASGIDRNRIGSRRPNSDLAHCPVACCLSNEPSSDNYSSDSHFTDLSDGASRCPSGYSAGYFGNHSAGCSSDAQLVARVLNGEERAREEFVERYRRFVYALLRRRDLRAQDRDDIYQELYARLWQHDMRGIRRWQATGMREFKPYLSAMVRHLICDHQRGQKGIDQPGGGGDDFPYPLIGHGPGQEGGEACPVALLLRKEQRDMLRQAIARLSTRDADIVCRRYFVGQSYQEIGAALGMTTGNVGVTLAHIRKRLRKHLTILGIEVFEGFIVAQKRTSKARRCNDAK